MSTHREDLTVARTSDDATDVPCSCIRVLVVDDQRLFRESIVGILALEPAFEVVGSAADGAEGITLARQLVPDVILMDVKMPHVDGIAAIRQIKAELPKTRIVLLTTFTSDGYVLEGLAAGANGYLLKDTSVAGLTSAIRAVYAGEQVTAPEVTLRMMQLLEKQQADGDQQNDGLTAREMETLLLVARGMIAKEIARTLSISEKTVRNHISNIYRKLGIYDRSQVVIYAMKKGLITLQEA
ncbi:MAG TPA: response regulator transcription factor [Ktedonobacteraceae bacterium]|nr:response regulator transcription factor [Ktedonobacteraceae bacterium]